ncbi:hypothetical protein BS47DRAFT_1394422 [Hydnum rufescens UP504]|uniref:Uncharacterized protein n=1 Tax=Hydnum rufescens UP504 TaxID=1448309 RepID=A0A9P6AUR2_9AGAM|nr:hypothetical protein BS47DRAFT_1394422 [Hydnum rufescens UP504]
MRSHFKTADLNRDPFERPHEVEPNHPTHHYWIHGDGVFKTLGEDFVYRVAEQVLRTVFTRSNFKRATGSAGTLRRFLISFHPYTDAYLFVLKPGPVDKAF